MKIGVLFHEGYLTSATADELPAKGIAQTLVLHQCHDRRFFSVATLTPTKASKRYCTKDELADVIYCT